MPYRRTSATGEVFFWVVIFLRTKPPTWCWKSSRATSKTVVLDMLPSLPAGWQNSDWHWQKLELFFATGMTAIWQPKPSLFSLFWGLRAPAFLQVRDLVLPTSYGVDGSLCIRDLSTTAFHCATGSKRYGLQLADRIYLIGPTGLIQEAWAVIGLVQYKNTLYTAQLPFIGHDQWR